MEYCMKPGFPNCPDRQESGLRTAVPAGPAVVILFCAVFFFGCTASDTVSNGKGLKAEKTGREISDESAGPERNRVRTIAIQDSRIRESSGLAISRKDPALLWTHNDSDNAPQVFALSTRGTVEGVWGVPGTRNTDWEDISSCMYKGISFLLVADTGNNSGKRNTFQLYFFPEPENGKNIQPSDVRGITFRYESGAPDCEAVSIDPVSYHVYLIVKTSADDAGVFRLPPPLQWTDQEAVALKKGSVPISGATGFEFSPDGTKAVICTYGNGFLFEKREGQEWPDAFAGKPETVSLPFRIQGEAVCWSADSAKLYLTTESPPWGGLNVLLYEVALSIGEKQETNVLR